ncbi:MAG: flagellar export chaperone FliS [Gammaproteobacteria bacterium]|nr:flagellar export chaperone FliS [Gammaproteobacteria bacterium]
MTRFSTRPAGAKHQTYARVGVQTGIEAASPHRLIVMLMDGALARIASAQGHLERGEIAAKGACISMAISIIDGLRGSLDRQAGGALAANLDELYRYMGERLLGANLKNDADALGEVRRLLGEIRGAWVAIGAAGEPARVQGAQ